jgi:hypothetical protein
VAPSVRGRERFVVAVVLAASAAASGALAGFAGGVVGSLATAPGPGVGSLAGAPGQGVGSLASAPGSGVVAAVVAAVVALAVALDLSPLPPLSVRRQVPQLWGRIFSAPATALLYGARLGVGPLTILRTWWWWAAFVLGALAGVWWSVAVGAVFGAVRIAVMLVAGTRAPAWGQRRERGVAVLASAAVVAVATATVLGAIPAMDGHERAQNVAAPRRAGVQGGVVDRPPSGAARPAPPAPPDTGLGSWLPEELGGGFTRAPDDPGRGLGPLDLATAVALEQDPAAERALLETRRFQSGHARAWRSGAGVVVYAAVYGFASPADAAAYLVDGFLTLESRGARVSDVADPPGGRAFSQAASDRDGSRVAHGVAFTRGDRFFLVFESSRTSAATAEHAAGVARTVDAWQRAAAVATS